MKSCISLAVVCILSLNVNAQLYHVTDLGTLGGNSSNGWALNNFGQIVGYSVNAAGETHAFLFSGGVMADLGVLQANHHVSYATGINDSGVVVGSSRINFDAGASSGSQSFIYSNGSMSNPGTFGGDYGFANAINPTGVVVGLSRYATGATHAYRYDGTMHDLNIDVVFDYYSDAYAINAVGQIVGIMASGPNADRGFLWQNGVTTDLGFLQGGVARTEAYDINNLGHIVGASNSAESGGIHTGHAILWKDGAMGDLGVLPDGSDASWAYGINDNDVVVGRSYNETLQLGGRAFVWSPTTGMRDLNGLLDSSGANWLLDDARDVNNLGQIVGSGRINGEVHAYLLTIVPEPTTMLTAVALVVLGLRRSPRKS
jgi:probable HAF family extracellular repeat protein